MRVGKSRQNRIFSGFRGFREGFFFIHSFHSLFVGTQEDNMGFGWPTKYWQLTPAQARGEMKYDEAVLEANEEYKKRMVRRRKKRR